jgi:signal transduction histidine kinase
MLEDGQVVPTPVAARTSGTEDLAVTLSPDEGAPERPVISRTIANRAIQERVSVLVQDAQMDQQLRVQPSIAFSAIRSAMCVPLVHQDAVKALILLDAKTARAFVQEDLELVTAIANQAAVALANTELYEELRRAYEDLQSAQEQLMQSEKLSTIGTLAASVAHDIGNVLTPITAVAGKVIRSQEIDPQLRDIFERQIQRLRALTQQLLSFSRSRATTLTSVEINQAIEESLSLVRTEARHRGVEISEELAGNLPTVRADTNRLDQVFINIMLNAVQAMEKSGGGKVGVRTSHEAGMVTVSFTDSGPGIPPETLARIFEPFFTTKGDKGNGLGLFSCKTIIEDEHGGKLRVQSRVGEGTTFTVELPAH